MRRTVQLSRLSRWLLTVLGAVGLSVAGTMPIVKGGVLVQNASASITNPSAQLLSVRGSQP